jgi:putative oxidoreductase
MSVTRRVARPLLAGMFVFGGLDSAQRPDTKSEAAERIVGPLGEAVGRKMSATGAVRVNGIAQVLAGVLFGFGVAPRLAAAVLAGTLVPTTLAGHRFWEEEDPGARVGQQIHFLKNAAMLGGLLLAVVDTEGEPSLSWRAHRAFDGLEQRVGIHQS